MELAGPPPVRAVSYTHLDVYKRQVFKGSDTYLTDPERPVHSDAAHDLVEKAMASDDLLYVVSIGEITNVASALMLEPRCV